MSKLSTLKRSQLANASKDLIGILDEAMKLSVSQAFEIIIAGLFLAAFKPTRKSSFSRKPFVDQFG